ncbi:hypothetical protein PIB30_050904 [Stylosanthes scabra]|uniref:Beta-galactosidase galactose-binding domain-containing protein n=1 Tax=Stylosanthes scabra TaxID=79078 RepID=A0ABU6YF68_9FABA|nr:hypothetical protein [Stylosanthes scabra]
MGKGEIWINGQSIGRHWPGYKAGGSCGACNYAGTFTQTNYGQPSQRWYHVPRAWLRSGGNSLAVFQEWGGNPAGISLVKRTCGVHIKMLLIGTALASNLSCCLVNVAPEENLSRKTQ